MAKSCGIKRQWPETELHTCWEKCSSTELESWTPKARMEDPRENQGGRRVAEPSTLFRAEPERRTMVSCTVSTSWADTETGRVELALEGGVQTGCEEAGMTAHTCFNSRVKTGQRWSVV